MIEPEGLPEKPFPEPAPEAKPYPFWGYQDLAVLAGLMLPVIIISILAVRLIAGLVPEGEAVPAAGVLAAQFVAYGLWFACLWGLIRFRYDKPFWPSLAWVPPRGSLYGYFALGPVLAFAVGIAGAALQTPEIQMPMMDLLRDRLSLILVGVFAVTLGPLCEELAFRGFFLPLLARSLGPVTGIVITSAVFALLHGPQYGGSWRHILLIGLAGATFGVVRLLSGSTLAATAMHATYNLTFFAAFLAQGDSFPN